MGRSGTTNSRDTSPEAVARQTQRMHEEVQRTSSLPSAMFEACDPMLEAKIAEATRGLLSYLLTLVAPADGLDEATENLRIERVQPEELLALCGRLEHETDPPPLGEGLPEELLGVLVDLGASGDPHSRRRAADRICRHLDLETKELQSLAHELTEQLDGLFGPGADRAETCARIAEALAPMTPPEPGAAQDGA